jgi:hypothetical protein
LKTTVWKNYLAGTNIRGHSSWGAYNYRAAVYSKVPTTWTKYSWEVKGISKFWVNNNYFKRWTKYIKILILANYHQNSDAKLLIDDLKLVEY